MKESHILFNKNIVDFFLNIDNKRTANAVGEVSGCSNESRYIFVRKLRDLELITTKPLQLTKKGEWLRKKLICIYKLLDNGYK